MNKKNYTVREDKGIAVLQANKTDQICPFMQPVPIKTSLGQFGMAPQACNSTCPHFNVEQHNIVSLTCSGIPVVHKIEEPPVEPKLKSDHLHLN